MAICRLCLNDKKLCKSHIYPEFMYDNCYNEHHQFFDFNRIDYNKTRPKGYYEPLLCRSCEDKIKYYEDFAKDILYLQMKPFVREKKLPFTLFDYDYNRFKLFTLSLIWRASVSRLPFFSKVSLGKYEEELRTILHDGKITKINYCPTVIYQTHIDNHLADGVFFNPFMVKAKKDFKTIYVLTIDGLFIYFGIGYCHIASFPVGTSISPEKLRFGYSRLTQFQPYNESITDMLEQGKFSVYED